ncbi:MAG TPA: glycosyltransferase [Faecalibacter sp.]
MEKIDMTTIIIKSFNRPFYLDRCLKSLSLYIKGEYEIIILDDGTPKKYLEKIIQLYPNIILKKSNQFEEKNRSIEDNIKTGKPIDGFSIPTDLWYNAIRNSSDYVLVIEDDVWLTDYTNLNEIVEMMKTRNIVLTKLGWLGNFRDDQFCDIKPLSETLHQLSPKNMFTSNKFIMDLFMYNKLKFFSILYKLGVVDNLTKRKYWAINSILMGLYKKEYWLSIWEDAKGRVDEKQQLRNAAAYYHKNREIKFARTSKELLKTTFKSSATGSYHKEVNQFDVNRMNYILNEAWLIGEFDSMENYPKDFSDDYIKSFLEISNHPYAQYNEWFKWANKFRDQYRKNGAEVDN